MVRAAADSLKGAAVEAVKPRLRGVLHQYSFFVALAGGAVLIIVAHGARTRVAMTVYAPSGSDAKALAAVPSPVVVQFGAFDIWL